MRKRSNHNVLTIAASDTSGGAGVQRDLRTFQDAGVRGFSVVTGITAQSFDRVLYAGPLCAGKVEIQLKTVFENFRVSTVKIGVVFNLKIMKLAEYFITKHRPKNVVIDPVLSASDGTKLLNHAGFDYFRERFLKIAGLITPNIPELEKLSGSVVKNEKDIIANARLLSEKYGSFVLVKGGHSTGRIVRDFLVKNDFVRVFECRRKKLSQSHGTGCMISSAIAANLAKGLSMEKSVKTAKNYVLQHFLS